MGWPPQIVLGCTAYQFWAAWGGFYEFNSGGQPEPMTKGELHRLLHKVSAQDGRTRQPDHTASS